MCNLYFDVIRNSSGNTAEEFFIDVILQKQARRLLSARRLTDLGYFAAHLDFHLVAWLGKERDRAARIDDFIKALKQLHEDIPWPYPTPHPSSIRQGSSGKYKILYVNSSCINYHFKALLLLHKRLSEEVDLQIH